MFQITALCIILLYDRVGITDYMAQNLMRVKVRAVVRICNENPSFFIALSLSISRKELRTSVSDARKRETSSIR